MNGLDYKGFDHFLEKMKMIVPTEEQDELVKKFCHYGRKKDSSKNNLEYVEYWRRAKRYLLVYNHDKKYYFYAIRDLIKDELIENNRFK